MKKCILSLIFVLLFSTLQSCTPDTAHPIIPTPTITASNTIPLLPEKITKGPTTKNLVSLTFDLEVYDSATEKLLQMLRLQGVTTTFFIQGGFVRNSPRELVKLAEEGHELGNHSWTHPYFPKESDEKVREEIETLEKNILEKTGKSTKPLLRAPYGASTEKQQILFNQLGYREIYWTIDTNDWKEDMTAQVMINGVLKQLKPGSIILMHNIGDYTVESTATLIPAIRSKGYEIVPVSKLF